MPRKKENSAPEPQNSTSRPRDFETENAQVVGVVTRDELTELTMKGQELIEVMNLKTHVVHQTRMTRRTA